jgi:hypothetical protein
MESIGPIKHFHPSATASSANVSIDVAVTEFLVNGRQPDAFDIRRKELREHFPSADVAQEKDDWFSFTQFLLNAIKVLGLEMLR